MNTFSAPASPSLAQKQRQTWRHSMFMNGRPVLKDGNLNINSKDLLRDVPENILVTPLTNTSAFVGATSTQSLSRHVFKLGFIHLSEGGTPAKLLIIDNGWQDTSNEFQKKGETYVEGSQFGGRLVSIKENSKFRGTANLS
ncbi:hypothetical protein QYF36_020453 [Acer negundo]|nr:hypothetical protein QYF36_020453 [Acer negundo]